MGCPLKRHPLGIAQVNYGVEGEGAPQLQADPVAGSKQR